MTTYYVRSDGGTEAQSTGLVNAAYPGSGTGTASAYKELQDALDNCTYGDTIIVRAGDTFVPPLEAAFDEPFYLPGKGTPPTNTDADFITVKSSNAASLSGRVCRTLPATTDRANMAKILTNSVNGAFKLGDPNAGDTGKAAKYWKIQGFELTNTGTDVTAPFISIGQYKGIEHIWFDQCYIHPQEDGTDVYVRTGGIGLSISSPIDATGTGTKDIRLTNSRVSGFGGLYEESGASGVLTGSVAIATGPMDGFTVTNNFLEGTFQCWFPGGIDSTSAMFGVVQASPTPTLTSCTLDSVTGLVIGDWVAIEQVSLASQMIAQAKITGISGNNITFTSVWQYINGGVAPIAGKKVYWRGLTSINHTVTKNTFCIPVNIVKGIYAASGNRYANGAANASTNIISGITHAFGNPIAEGEEIFFHSDTPGGLTQVTNGTASTYTPYYAKNVTGTTTQTLQVAATVGGAAIDLTSATTATTLSTAGSHPKGYVEAKVMENALFEGNIFEGYQTDFLLQGVNQNGDSPWSRNNNITIQNNWFKDAGTFNFKTGSEVTTGHHRNAVGDNAWVLNNLISSGYGLVAQFIEVGSGMRFEHNTWITDPTWDSATASMITGGFATAPLIKNNIFQYSRYGWQCGNGAMSTCYSGWPTSVEIANAIRNDLGVTSDAAIAALWPASYVATGANAIAFIGSDPDVLTDWRLAVGSQYRAGGARDASDSTDVGVDIDALIAALAGNDGYAEGAEPDPYVIVRAKWGAVIR